MNYNKKFKEYIEKNKLFPQEKEHIVLISGGKDSNALITLLEEYKKEQPQVKITYLNIVFPQKKIVKEIPLTKYTSITPRESNEELDNAEDPCKQCKNIRTTTIEEYLKEKDIQNIIIHTGHTTDDIIAYFIELFNLSIKEHNIEDVEAITIEEKDFEHFSRHLPKITFQSGITLAKPMLKFNRREINNILQQKGVTKNATSCDYASKRPKRNIFAILNKLSRQEVEEIYDEFSLEQMQRLFKEKITNYDQTIEHIEQEKYKKYIL